MQQSSVIHPVYHTHCGLVLWAPLSDLSKHCSPKQQLWIVFFRFSFFSFALEHQDSEEPDLYTHSMYLSNITPVRYLQFDLSEQLEIRATLYHCYCTSA